MTQNVIWKGDGKCNLPFTITATGHPLEPVFSIQVDCCVAKIKDQLNGLFLTVGNKSTVIRQRKVLATNRHGSPTYSVVDGFTEINLVVLTVLFNPDLRPGFTDSWPLGPDPDSVWKAIVGNTLAPDTFFPLFEKIGEAQIKIHYNYLLHGLKKSLSEALAVPEFSESYLMEAYKEAVAKAIMNM